MTWENVNKHNGIVRIGVESTFGTTASNMKALLNRADPPWPLAGKDATDDRAAGLAHLAARTRRR